MAYKQLKIALSVWLWTGLCLPSSNPNVTRRITGEFGLPTPRLLAAARALVGLSQRELAAEAGLNPSVIGRYEAGLSVMRGETIERVIRVLRARGIRFLGATATTSMGLVLEKAAVDRKPGDE